MEREQIQLNLSREDESASVKQAVEKTRAKRQPKTPEQKAQEQASRQHNMLVKKLSLIHENVAHMSVEGLEIVKTKSRLRAYFEKIYANKLVAIDTETGGFDCYTDPLAGLCLFTPGENAIYVPVGHVNLQGNLTSDNLNLDDEVMIMIKDMLEDKSLKQIYHNAKFDAKFLATNFDADCHIFWDTLVAGHLLNENESHSLKDLWGKYCNGGDSADKFGALFNKVDFRYVPVEDAYPYAAKDSKITFELYEFQQRHLRPDNPKLKNVYDLYTAIELPLINVLTRMELRGVALDHEFSKQLSLDYNKKKDEVELNIRTFIASIDPSHVPAEKLVKLSNPINLNSSAQMSIIFYDLIGLPRVNKEKPNSTDAETVKKLIERFSGKTSKKAKEAYEFLKWIEEYRGLSKLITSFIDSLPESVNPVTGKIHAKNNSTGTVTGRMSMSGPNLQQIPAKNKDVRKMFVPDEGMYMIGLDYSQQEPRVLAFLSQDEHLLETYSTGKDVYAFLASHIYKVPYEECLEFYEDGSPTKEGKARRSSTKSILLGKMYGRGANAVAEALGISKKEGKEIVDLFDFTFPKVQKLIDKNCAFASTYGYVETVYGRKRRLPDMMLAPTDFNNQRIARASRQVLNSIIQGTGADIVKKSLIQLDHDPILKELGFEILFSVHDEILGQAPKENALKAARRMKEIMASAPNDRINVPFKVDGEISERWYGDNLLVEWHEKL